MIHKTTTRVADNTPSSINERIRCETQERIAHYAHSASPERIWARLEELDWEWDVERVFEAQVSVGVLVGLLLGRFVDRRLYAVPGIIASFLALHAVQGWAPPIPVLRWLGFRTESEIEVERRALERLC